MLLNFVFFEKDILLIFWNDNPTYTYDDDEDESDEKDYDLSTVSL